MSDSTIAPDFIGQLAGEGEADAITGTRRLWLYRESAESGAYGDAARGFALVSRYISDDGYGCGELAVYPEVLSFDESSGIEVLGVTEQWTWGRAVREGDSWQPDDCAETTYDEVGAHTYDTLANAQREADRIGRLDSSYCIYLRNRTPERKGE